MDLSVVVPVYNEEENVDELHRRIVDALAPEGFSFELLLVDDGSRDRTVERLVAIQRSDPRVRAVKLRRNFGQTPAMRAGIDLARGDVIVTMDGDLQNDPRDIPMLMAKLAEGYDLVTGWRFDRKDAFLSRRLPSKVANWLIGRITGVRIHDNGCSLKAYRGDVIKKVPLYSEMHRFIPAMSTLAGTRITEVVVRHHPRLRGTSKYGLSRVGKVILDLITVKMLIAFSQRPLHWFGLGALASLTASVAAMGLALVAGELATGGPSIVFPTVSLLFAFLATHFVVTGLAGELIVRTGRPHDFRATSRVRIFPGR
jgi:glycosyltransferase involved in cell wall biosynthesis